jgi:hypothetical protein
LIVDDIANTDDLLEIAWNIIANAGWDDCAKSPGWQDAAVRWRDKYFATHPIPVEPTTMQKEHARHCNLLGKRVKVWLDRKAHYPAIPDLTDIPGKGAIDTEDVIVVGVLVGFGDDGTFEIMEDDGFIIYGWPMLEIEEVTNEVS